MPPTARSTTPGSGWKARRWVPGPYTVKLEGARIAGYQTITLAILRDRRYVANARPGPTGCTGSSARRRSTARMGLGAGRTMRSNFALIGVDATLGPLETRPGAPDRGRRAAGRDRAHARTSATEIAKIAQPVPPALPADRDRGEPTFAFPFSPAEIDARRALRILPEPRDGAGRPDGGVPPDLDEVGHG